MKFLVWFDLTRPLSRVCSRKNSVTKLGPESHRVDRIVSSEKRPEGRRNYPERERSEKRYGNDPLEIF